MNKNAVFIKNFTFRLRNISCRAKRYLVCNISHRRKPIYNATSAEGAIPEKIYSRAHCINMISSTLLILKIDISEHYVRTRKTGCRGGSPCKRNDVILRSARRQLCDEGSRADRVVPRSARCHNKVVCCEFP